MPVVPWMNEEKSITGKKRISVKKKIPHFHALAPFFLPCQRESSNFSFLLTTKVINFLSFAYQSSIEIGHAFGQRISRHTLGKDSFSIRSKVARWRLALGRMPCDFRTWHAHLLALCVLHGLPKWPCIIMMVQLTSGVEDGKKLTYIVRKLAFFVWCELLMDVFFSWIHVGHSSFDFCVIKFWFPEVFSGAGATKSKPHLNKKKRIHWSW